MNATKTASQYRRDRIKFSDGSEGYQSVMRDSPDERWQLTEVVITKSPSGARREYVYAAISDVMAYVYSLSSLAGLTWEIIKSGEITN